jgi:hypothetical protein
MTKTYGLMLVRFTLRYGWNRQSEGEKTVGGDCGMNAPVAVDFYGEFCGNVCYHGCGWRRRDEGGAKEVYVGMAIENRNGESCWTGM